MSTPILDLGRGPWSGAYILHIAITQAARVVFGRFANGAAVVVEPGNYLYIGSAQSRHTGYALPRRVLRHLTRTGDLPPHGLRDALLAYLRRQGWPAAHATDGKTLRWHIDYLLDLPAAEVTQVALVRDGRTGERELLAWLVATGKTAPLLPGLGAGDHPGHTHLLRWTADDAAWQQFTQDLTQRLDP